MVILEKIEEEDVILSIVTLYPEMTEGLTVEDKLKKDHVPFNVATLAEEIGNYKAYYHLDRLVALYFEEVQMLIFVDRYTKSMSKKTEE